MARKKQSRVKREAESYRRYRHVAELLHAMTCISPDCNYPDPPDMDYMAEHKRVCMDQNKMNECKCSSKIKTVHCMRAVMAENLAAELTK